MSYSDVEKRLAILELDEAIMEAGLSVVWVRTL